MAGLRKAFGKQDYGVTGKADCLSSGRSSRYLGSAHCHWEIGATCGYR